MGAWVFILLAIAWAIVLVPPVVRHRSDLRPGSSVTNFKQDLDVIGRTTPSGSYRAASTREAPPLPGTPSGRSAVRKRRRDVLFCLGGTAGFTLLLALAFGGAAWLLHLAVDAALVGYLYLLVQMRKMAEQQSMRIPYMEAPPQSQPRLVEVRRTANG